MQRIAKPDGGPVVEQTVTTKTVGPVSQSSFPGIPASTPKKSANEDINEWFGKLNTAERANDFNYYLYRLDRNIVITTPEVDGREPRKYLTKLNPEVLARLAGGSFMDELVDWIKDPEGGDFGGGKYALKITTRKTGTMLFNKFLDVEGEPHLIGREAFAAGSAPGQVGVEAVLPQMLQMIREEIRSVREGSQSPQAALGQVMQTMMQANAEAFKFALDRQPKEKDPAERLKELEIMFSMFDRLMTKNMPATAAAPPLTPMQQMREVMEMEKLMRERDGAGQAITPASVATAVVESVKQIGVVKGVHAPWYVEVAQAVAPLAPVLTPIALAAAEFIRARSRAVDPGVSRQQPGIRNAAGGPAIQQPGAAPRVPSGGPAGGPSAGAGGPAAMPVGGRPGNQPPPPANMPSAAPQPQQQAPQSPAQEQDIIPGDVVDAVIWNRATTRLVAMLQDNRDGEDCAASVNDIFPEVASKIAFAPKMMIDQIIKDDPVLAPIADDPRLPQFLEEFRAYFTKQGTDATEAKVQ